MAPDAAIRTDSNGARCEGRMMKAAAVIVAGEGKPARRGQCCEGPHPFPSFEHLPGKWHNLAQKQVGAPRQQRFHISMPSPEILRVPRTTGLMFSGRKERARWKVWAAVRRGMQTTAATTVQRQKSAAAWSMHAFHEKLNRKSSAQANSIERNPPKKDHVEKRMKAASPQFARRKIPLIPYRASIYEKIPRHHADPHSACAFRAGIA